MKKENNKPRLRVLTTGGSPVSLAIIRSLGREGIDVSVISNSKNHYTCASKYCKEVILVPNRKKTDEEIVDEFFSIVKSGHYDVFLPVVDEPTLSILSKRKPEFEKYVKMPIVDFDVFERASDKASLMRKAEELGIPHPKTFFIKDPEEIDNIIKDLVFPVVIKPHFGCGAKGVVFVNNPADLKKEFSIIAKEHGPSMIQEFIPGEKYSVSALFNKKSEPRRFMCHRCIRQYPAGGGILCLGETVYRQDIQEYTFKLLKGIDYSGIACIEYVIDERDDLPKLIEINPRFYGSLPLSILGGVNYPYLVCRMALEGDIEENWDYNKGIRCRSLVWRDFKHLHYVLTHDNIPNYKISKLQTVINFLKFYEDDGYYISSFDDPKPIIKRLQNNFLSILRSLFTTRD